MKSTKPDLRPLTGRTLKSLGDTLRFYLPNTRVLDLFSGTGRFAAMASDAGAKEVVCVERDSKLLSDLKKIPKVRVYGEEVFRYCEKSEGAFDIVFADPPYRLWEGAFVDRLFGAVEKVVRPGGIFLVRYPRKMVPSLPSEGWESWKTTHFGDAEVAYLKRHGDPS